MASHRKKKPRYPAALDGAQEEDVAYPGYAKLLWFDPGGTTGWCLMVVHPEALTEPDVPILHNIEYKAWGEIPGAGMDDEGENIAISRILELISDWPQTAIGTESFRLRQFTKDLELLTPVRLNKVMRYALWAGDWGRLWEQQPDLAKKTASDVRLKEWGLYDSHSGPHARDATRHAITFLRRAKGRQLLREMAWPWLYAPKQEQAG